VHRGSVQPKASCQLQGALANQVSTGELIELGGCEPTLSSQLPCGPSSQGRPAPDVGGGQGRRRWTAALTCGHGCERRGVIRAVVDPPAAAQVSMTTGSPRRSCRDASRSQGCSKRWTCSRGSEPSAGRRARRASRRLPSPARSAPGPRSAATSAPARWAASARRSSWAVLSMKALSITTTSPGFISARAGSGTAPIASLGPRGLNPCAEAHRSPGLGRSLPPCGSGRVRETKGC